MSQGGSPSLVLGPLLRYVDHDSATVWVETSGPCRVTLRAGQHTQDDETWGLYGHHYALVHIGGLEQGAELEYTIELDGEQVWPLDPGRPSLIRTPADNDRTRLVFGSCRRGEPETPDSIKELGADALAVLAREMDVTDHDVWPDALLLLGDQVYADMPGERVLRRLHRRRQQGLGPAAARESAGQPGDADVSEEICDFEEYSWLYHESWANPDVRWLLSTVPSCMILDDHDLRDDWNTSRFWRRDMTAQPWWSDWVIGAFSSYFVYQHLGNPSPAERQDDRVYSALRAASTDEERERILADFSILADSTPGSAQWSFHRDFGRVRVIMLDVRASRHLEAGERSMMDGAEWDWVLEKSLEADVDHLLFGTSLPAFMVPAIHHLEGWNERVIERGAPDTGRSVGRIARARFHFHEWVRRVVDLEHWAAYRASFDALVDLLTRIAQGKGASARPPATILVLAGDVHCSYLEEVDLHRAAGSETEVHQLVMSPFRNPLHKPIRVVNKIAVRKPVVAALRRLAGWDGVEEPEVSWEVTDGIWFENGVMTLDIAGRSARVEVDHAVIEDGDRSGPEAQRLRRTLEKKLSRD